MGEIEETHKSTTSNHVAVLAFPFGTHAVPLLTLTQRLAEAAPNTSFSFFSTAKSNRSLSGSQHRGIGNIKVYDIDDGMPEGYVYTGNLYEEMELFFSVVPENFRKGVEKAVLDSGKNVTCFLSDLFICHTADMAEELNVPWIPFSTSSACSLSSHVYLDLIRETVAAVDPSGRDELPLNFVPGMPSALRIKDMSTEGHDDNLDSVIAGLLRQMSRMIPRCSAMVVHSFEQLELSIIQDLKTKIRHVLAIGPFSLTSPLSSTLDPYNCISWLNSQEPASVVYVSFGTVVTPPPPELMALAVALEMSGVPFLWSLKDKLKKSLPEGFLDRTAQRGMIVPWTPQPKVLQHTSVGAFLTHCGWNSVLESVTGGVPMICRPFFGDQKMNARLVSDVWGIGVGAKDGVLSKDGLIEAFDFILSKEEGMRMKVATLKELAIQAVGHQGTSTINFDFLLGIVTNTNRGGAT